MEMFQNKSNNLIYYISASLCLWMHRVATLHDAPQRTQRRTTMTSYVECIIRQHTVADNYVEIKKKRILMRDTKNYTTKGSKH